MDGGQQGGGCKCVHKISISKEQSMISVTEAEIAWNWDSRSRR